MTEPAGRWFANALTEVLLTRDDVEHVTLRGSGPTTLRLTSGEEIPGPPLEMADPQLLDFLRRMAGSARPGPSTPPGNTSAGGNGGTDGPDREDGAGGQGS